MCWIPEFCDAMSAADAPVVVWLDFMKMGRLSNSSLNTMADLVAKALKGTPEATCCVAIAPHLTSERVGTQREEMRPGLFVLYLDALFAAARCTGVIRG